MKVGSRVSLASIELDSSIQCRAVIDTNTVHEYSDAMSHGAAFPPVELFGSIDRSWIGDGWHRVFAARQCGDTTIQAHLHPGGRVDALKAALSANTVHGQRRTNADKRRAVEIALREFPKLSSRAIAEMCGVGADLVISVRPQVSENDTLAVTGQDGKQYPARRPDASPGQPADPKQTVTARRAEQAIPNGAPGLLRQLPKRSAVQIMSRLADTLVGSITALQQVNLADLATDPSAAEWCAAFQDVVVELRAAIKALSNKVNE